MEVLSAQVAAAAAVGLSGQQQHSPGSQVRKTKKKRGSYYVASNKYTGHSNLPLSFKLQYLQNLALTMLFVKNSEIYRKIVMIFFLSL